MAGGKGDDVDYDKLSDYLKALANPNRLELLYQLRFPRTAAEVYLRPKRSEPTGANPDRYISRQAVERHLSLLEGIQVVKRQKASRDGRAVEEFVVNHPRLFAIVEELRRISHIKSLAPVDPGATSPASPLDAPPQTPSQKREETPGTYLLLVAGVFEGRRYALEGDGPWEIGRAPEAPVCLDYDPFVSTRNTLIRPDGDGFVVEDVDASRNGTTVNYEPLPKGGSRRLENGDLVGVGRSLLLFRTG